MNTEPAIPDPDGFYEAWADAQQGLGDDACADLNARLVLLLANQIGNQQVLLDCIAAARARPPSSARRSAADAPAPRAPHATAAPAP